jgi:hypothetical protein
MKSCLKKAKTSGIYRGRDVEGSLGPSSKEEGFGQIGGRVHLPQGRWIFSFKPLLPYLLYP